MADFSGVPLLIIGGLLILAVLVLWADHSSQGWSHSLRSLITEVAFQSPATTGEVLNLLGGGLLTMTSLTVSMLLLALQQTATNMGNLVYDQFKKRRGNRVLVGYIIGAVVFSIVLRPFASDSFNPVISVSFATVIGVVAVVSLVYFLYSTIYQMRPQTIVKEIHNTTLSARQHQLEFLARTRRDAQLDTLGGADVRSATNGYVVDVELDPIASAISTAPIAVEIEAYAHLGSYVTYNEVIARVRCDDPTEAEKVADQVKDAYRLYERRQDTHDAAFGLEQFEMTAWTEMSSAKQNPETGLFVINAVGDVLSRWSEDHSRRRQETLPFVYRDDVDVSAIGVLESLAIVSQESHQHQGMALILETITEVIPRMNDRMLRRTDELIQRTIPLLEEQTLSTRLDHAMSDLVATLRKGGETPVAVIMEDARTHMAGDVPDAPGR